MKKLTFTLATILICLTTVSFVRGQAPVANDDYYDVFSMRTDTLRVLENDFAFDEHAFKLQHAFSPGHGEIDFDDSLIYLTPDMNFKGVDSLNYIIIDLENNLWSEMATVYLNIDNKGFDTLNTNNIRCRINANGTQFWDMDEETLFEAPANSGINALFSQSLWMGAFDQGEVLHVAGYTYAWDGSDFYPGPVMEDASYTNEYDVNWNRVWMLHQTDIDFHRANWQEPGYEMIENISTWPAHFDPSLAPFYDVDGNEDYNPENGDFPLISGDQAIYFVFNDDRGQHAQTNGEKLAMEIHAMYYAYDRPEDSTLNNTIFASYKTINKSGNDYHDYYLGFFNDFDIGCMIDDYVGTDTVLNSMYGYNTTPIDSTFCQINYGNYPPALSFTALNFDIASTMSFHGYGEVPTKLPEVDFEYYNYLKAIWLDSTHLTAGGQGYGGAEPINYIYPGNPVTGEGWSEVSANNEIDDRRGLVSTGPYSLDPDDEIELDFALVFARDYTGGDLANLNSVSLLKERIAEVQDFYDGSLGEEEFQLPQVDVEIYPNPFDEFITIKSDINSQNLSYSVFDIIGEVIISGTVQNNQSQINLKNLIKGIYFIRVSDGRIFETRKIIKN
jgi:hypothetical protein